MMITPQSINVISFWVSNSNASLCFFLVVGLFFCITCANVYQQDQHLTSHGNLITPYNTAMEFRWYPIPQDLALDFFTETDLNNMGYTISSNSSFYSNRSSDKTCQFEKGSIDRLNPGMCCIGAITAGHIVQWRLVYSIFLT